MRAWSLVMLMIVSGGCAHQSVEPGRTSRKFVQCNNTLTCRAMQAERKRQFARVVAQEPPAVRLEVEPVSSLALVDRRRQLVYVNLY